MVSLYVGFSLGAFMTDIQQLMKQNTIVKHYAGSLSYGTNLPSSDVDFRGIFSAAPINIRTPQHRRHVRSGSVTKQFVENERIVCFMVKNYTLITRQNGQIGLHGNTKHAMHLVRLLRMGHEVLKTGQLLVKRPDAEELLNIRRGAWTWTYDQLVEYAEFMDNEARTTLYQASSLPNKPDLQFAAQLLMDVQDLVWQQGNK